MTTPLDAPLYRYEDPETGETKDWPLLPTGTVFEFHSPYQYGPTDMPEAEFAARKGTPATVVAHITEAGPDTDEEVLPLYRVRFEDGREIDAWPEEVE